MKSVFRFIHAEICIVRWVCSVSLNDRLSWVHILAEALRGYMVMASVLWWGEADRVAFNM